MAINVGEAIAYLSLDMTAFNTGIQNANSALSSLADGSSLSKGLSAIGSVATSVGQTLTTNLTVPITNFGVSSIDAYKNFESAFTGVRKTMDDTAVEAIGGYQVLSDAIEQMSFETASSAEEIAYVMEVAGQLGVPLGKAGSDVINFTKTMVEMGDSTNLSAEEAATALAQFMNIAGTSWEDVGRLGSTIVDLGNNFATSEADITYMAQRLASAGTVAGLTETDILALSTAMASVGIKAEAGGSAMAQTLAQIEKIVQQAIGGDEGAIEQLKKLGMVSGMSAEEFANAWNNDPMTALQNFLLGMGSIEEKGESAILVLDDLGMSGVRQSNMLKALGLAGENLSSAIDTANTAWEENTALSIEAEKRYETLESRIQQLSNRWDAMKRDIAEFLIPVLEKLMDKVQKLIDWFRGLSEEQQGFIVKIAAVAAAVGPLLLVFGNLMQTIGLGVQSFSVIKTAVINFKEALALSQAGFVNFAGIASKVFALFSNFNPVILAVVAGISLLVAAFIKTYKESEEVREALAGVWESVKTLFEAVGGFVIDNLKALQPVIEIIIEILSNLLAQILPPLCEILSFAMDIISNILDLLGPILIVIGDIVYAMLWILKPAINYIIEVIKNVLEVISNIVGVVSNVIKLIVGILTGDGKKIEDAVNGIAENVKGLVDNALNFIWDLFFGWFFDLIGLHDTSFTDILSKLKDFGANAINSVSQGIENIWNKVKDFFGNLISKTKESFENLIQGIKDFVSNSANAIADFFKNMVSNIADFISTVFQKIGNLRDNLFNGIRNFISNMITTVGDFLSKMLYNIGEFLTKIPSNIAKCLGEALKVLSNHVKDFFNIGAKLFSSLWDGLKSIWDKIWGWLGNIVDKIKNIFSNIKSGFSNLFSGFGWNGSHANGLDYVPFDGYVAQLHKGERVLTKQENEEYNRGDGNSNSGGDVYNFYNTKPDPYEYARQMKRVKKELQTT